MNSYPRSEPLRASTSLSFMELLIILAIILIFAAIPVSNLFRYQASEHRNSAGANIPAGATGLLQPSQQLQLYPAKEAHGTRRGLQLLGELR